MILTLKNALPNIGVVGRKRAGKDEVAKVLVSEFGYQRVGLADAVKEHMLLLDPYVMTWQGVMWRLSEVVRAFGWERAKDEFREVRRLLQRYGTDVVRKHFGENVWVDTMTRKVAELNERGIPVVIPDVRFPNEADAFRTSSRHQLIRVTRPGLADLGDTHESELHADTIPVDFEVINDGTIEDLTQQVLAVVDTVRGVA
jgi:hypothetical protein